MNQRKVFYYLEKKGSRSASTKLLYSKNTHITSYNWTQLFGSNFRLSFDIPNSFVWQTTITLLIGLSSTTIIQSDKYLYLFCNRLIIPPHYTKKTEIQLKCQKTYDAEEQQQNQTAKRKKRFCCFV